jgi:hypothetical protein
VVDKVNQQLLCIYFQSINLCIIVSHVDYREIHLFHHYLFYRSVHFLYADGGPDQTLSIFAKPFRGTYHLYTAKIKPMVHFYCLGPLFCVEMVSRSNTTTRPTRRCLSGFIFSRSFAWTNHFTRLQMKELMWTKNEYGR